MTRWWLLAGSKKLSVCGRAALRIWIVAALLGTPGTGGGEVARGAARAVSLSGVGGIASAVGALRLGVQALSATTVVLLASSGSALSALAQVGTSNSQPRIGAPPTPPPTPSPFPAAGASAQAGRLVELPFASPQISGASAATPQSCADVHNANPSAPDGTYTISVMGHALAIYCYHMASQPTEYLTLVHTESGANFARYATGGAQSGTDAITTYTKVRLDPATLKINTGDRSFATSVGSNSGAGGTETAVSYGWAGSCKAPYDSSGTANIDLRGTPFTVNDTWTLPGLPLGYDSAGVTTDRYRDKRVLDITGGGYCGWNVPTGQGTLTLAFAFAIPPAGSVADTTTASDFQPVTTVTSLDPVNTLNGDYQYSHTDLAISGRGPSPFFSRSYNSNDPRIGPLGQAWTQNYNMQLHSATDGTGDLFLIGAQGRSDRYHANSDGSFTPPASVTVQLSLTTTPPGYVAALPDQTAWSFDPLGRLTAITDRYGNQSTLAYSGAGQVSTVSDPANRGVLTFAYDPVTGLLTSVTDWSGRMVKYGYDTNNPPRLKTATDRNNQVTTYAYDGTTQHLTSITDANGHVALTMTYDSQGRVATQKDAQGLGTGQLTTFSYGVPGGQGNVTTTVTYPTTRLRRLRPAADRHLQQSGPDHTTCFQAKRD
jgi:YD repeat-containing protein